ncbi:MAG TPA: histidinol phosphate phosphatase [Methylomusa anaerophila]|uniref:Histidinol-phosphatase n=1 Tax=Methylomusa anaerophila TaxID=1930071 RepID=A0A348AK79_9FIRM|nr:histidinol phosphate phosphatase [Methylomusa anaerophila]BBB91477.1 histidinol-phosphatase [Methylomusa anaerophila]HML89934.1 histidinol phosphate phosphatase [Methylomusa anaerophila]
MLFDTHMHTVFSTDSRMTIGEAIAKGREAGLGIVITEHMDLAYPEPKKFLFDAAEYFQVYEKYRSDTVRLGIEIGMRTDCLEGNHSLVSAWPFDYVIGSVHVVDNIDIYQEGFYRLKGKAEVYRQYFDTMIGCLKCYDFIHSLGHIDYIARYARYSDPEVYYHEFREKIDEILTLLAEKGKAIEINTRRFGDKNAVENLLAIYRRFHELGGRLATIGSDAHRPEDIGRWLDVALEVAEATGLKPVWFKEGVPQYL